MGGSNSGFFSEIWFPCLFSGEKTSGKDRYKRFMSHQIVAGISNRSMYNALWKKGKPTHIICYGRLHSEGGIALDLVQDFESQGGVPEERHSRNESQDD